MIKCINDIDDEGMNIVYDLCIHLTFVFILSSDSQGMQYLNHDLYDKMSDYYINRFILSF